MHTPPGTNGAGVVSKCLNILGVNVRRKLYIIIFLLIYICNDESIVLTIYPNLSLVLKHTSDSVESSLGCQAMKP